MKQYFPEDVVLQGLFRLAQALYQIDIVPAQAPVWHEDVRFFEIRDAAGALVGNFYMDLYARETKRGGAWMDDAITRRRKGAGIQTPSLAHTNSPARWAETPLFTQDECLKMGHEVARLQHSSPRRGLGVSAQGWNGRVSCPQFMKIRREWDVLRT